jgi:glycosyltransferase involved in cell wall biosynthesis
VNVAVTAPRVSIVVPTYNRAADLARCLDSLRAQTFRDFEVLVCDDGSTDDSGAVCARYREVIDVSYHWAENFGGPARPRNRGVELARAPYVAFLDSDDWWAPRKLEESVRLLDTGADFVYHDLYEARSARQRFFWRRRRTRQLRAPAFTDLLLNGNAICNSSVVMRRVLLIEAGGFSEDRALIAWEDYDAWLRVARLTERFARSDAVLGYYWAGGGNISSPQRLIANLEKFGELYRPVVQQLGAAALPGWYHYLLGLAYYQLGSHRLVASHMRAALAAGLPRMQRAKAKLTAGMSGLQARFG